MRGSAKRRRSTTTWAVLTACLLLLSSCGARVSEGQRAAAGSGGLVAGAAGGADVSTGGSGGSGGADGATPAGGSGDAGGGGDTAGSASGTASAGGDGRSGATPAGAPGEGSASSPAASGDNGGATDVGVTATEYRVGTIATLSGPVPGLFQGAVLGAQAFAAYQNSQGGIHGRKLRIVARDDQFDAGQYRSHVQELRKEVFAFLGNFSLYDDTGVRIVEQHGIPDVGVGLSEARAKSRNNFSPAPNVAGGQVGPFNYLKRKFPGAVTAVGSIYSEVPASRRSHQGQKKAAESVGYRFIYERGFQATETDFTADVIRMRTQGVQFVYLSALDAKSAARFLQAVERQNFQPEAIVVYNTAYDAAFVPLAGSAANGIINIQTQAMFQGEDAGVVPEVKLLNEWIERVKPGATPDLFAVYGWASGRLFTEALQAAGPRANRAAVLAALAKIDDFDSNGILAPAGPASKRPSVCFLPTTVKSGRFQRLDTPRGFRCDDGPFLRL